MSSSCRPGFISWVVIITLVFLSALLAIVLLVLKNTEQNASGVKVIRSYPHDGDAWTQGLEYSNGFLWESTGLLGRSSLRRVNMTTGKVIQKLEFSDENLIFGEGMTLIRDKYIYMVSWKAGRGFVVDQKSFNILREWRYEGEGWGLAYNEGAGNVWMSDGTSVLRVLDDKTLKILRFVEVRRNKIAVKNINELEWICGELWANIWLKNDIIRIDPESGVVKGTITLSSLPFERDTTPRTNVMNGIAYDKENMKIFVTGKFWKKIYHIELFNLENYVFNKSSNLLCSTVN